MKMKCGLKKTAGLICLLIILAGTASCSMDRKIVFVDVPGSGSLGNSGTLPSGTYTVYHCRQKVTGGYEPSDYETYETETGINVAEGATADILKKSYEGFTVKSMMCNEDYICLFYDRNTITYTFVTGTDSTFSDGETSKTVSGLYGASYEKPWGFTSQDYCFSKWVIQGQSTKAPDTFGAEDLTCEACWVEWEDVDSFVLIQGDTFKMGSTRANPSKPVHQVTLTKSFYMCKHEVTQGEYEKYCSYTDSFSPRDTYGVGDRYPAYYVSWYDALVYCNRRSLDEDLTPCYTINGSTDPDDWIAATGGSVPLSAENSIWDSVTCNWTASGYRLPTEAEWEYAARGGNSATDTELYSGTSDSNELGDYAWYFGNAGGKAHEVGLKEPNAYGLYDMSGNVDEACWDWFQYYSVYSDDEIDPTGADYSEQGCVNRGGCYTDESNTAYYVSMRYSFVHFGRNLTTGFRVVRTAL